MSGKARWAVPEAKKKKESATAKESMKNAEAIKTSGDQYLAAGRIEEARVD